MDSILEHNSNLLNHQCCRVSQNTNNEIHQKSGKKHGKKSPNKIKNCDSNRNNTNVIARKKHDYINIEQHCNQKTFLRKILQSLMMP